jgi:hypothetical protein
MKVKRLIISFELLAQLFFAGEHSGGYSVIEDAIPTDAKLLNVRQSWPTGLELLIESNEFPEVSEGSNIPELTPKIRRFEYVHAEGQCLITPSS